jgi:tripartite-type tricarboxylate transporter receptor subunit TctC
LIGSTNAINATFYPKLNFNFIHDIAPVAGITTQPQVMLGGPSLSAKTISEVIAYAKANPGKVNVASPGVGAVSHLAGELFKSMAGVNLQNVPFGGNSPALTALLGGQVEISFASLPSAVEFIRTGKVKGLGVTTRTRSDVLPEVPSISEFVPGYDVVSWYGVGAPKGTPVEIIEKINNEVNAGVIDAKMKARLADLGGTPFVTSPAELSKFIAEDTEKWSELIREADIRRQ